MVVPKGTKQSASAEGESEEDPCAVATLTRVIHDLYAVNGSYAAVRGGRDSELIIWSEMLSTVRNRESQLG